MKKIARYFICALAFLSLFIQQLNAVSAVEVNSRQAEVGDIITYEVHAGGCSKAIIGVDASIYYDSTALQYVDGSLEIPNLEGFLANTDNAGEIKFNAADLSGYDFQNDAILATAQFEVISDYSPYPNLSYEIRNFMDSDKTELKGTYTYDLTYANGNSESVGNTVSSEAEDATDVQSTSDTDNESDNGKVSDVSDNSYSGQSAVVSSQSAYSENLNESDFDIESIGGLYSSNVTEEDAAIKDTIDTPDFDRTRAGIFIFLIAVAVIAIVSIAFVVIRRKSTGRHMSE